jgi:hypothetical protein
MASRNDYSPARLTARLAIQDVEYRWCRAIDRRDYASIPDLFHEDAYDDHGAYKGGITGLIDWLRVRHQSVEFCMHQMTNVLVEFADDENALAEIYLTVVQRYAPGEAGGLSHLVKTPFRSDSHVDLISRSRYVDRLQQRNGVWKILKRTFVLEWRQILEQDLEFSSSAGAAVGQRNLDDLVFRERAAMGMVA